MGDYEGEAKFILLSVVLCNIMLGQYGSGERADMRPQRVKVGQDVISAAFPTNSPVIIPADIRGGCSAVNGFNLYF